MAKNPLAHAFAQRDYHKAQFAKWEQYISLHMELYGEAQAPAPSDDRAPATRSPGPKTGAIAETRAGARLILEDAGDYVQSTTLIAKLGEMGVEVGGANPSSTLSARLSGDPEIESRRGYGYRLAKHAESKEAAGGSSGDEPAASFFTPNSADDDGREVAHDNMSR